MPDFDGELRLDPDALSNASQDFGQIVYEGAIDDIPTTKVEDLPKAKNLIAAALADMKAGRKVATPFAPPYGCSVKYKDA